MVPPQFVHGMTVNLLEPVNGGGTGELGRADCGSLALGRVFISGSKAALTSSATCWASAWPENTRLRHRVGRIVAETSGPMCFRPEVTVDLLVAITVTIIYSE